MSPCRHIQNAGNCPKGAPLVMPTEAFDDFIKTHATVSPQICPINRRNSST